MPLSSPNHYRSLAQKRTGGMSAIRRERKWEPEEENFLLNHPRWTDESCAKVLNRTLHGTRAKRVRLEISRDIPLPNRFTAKVGPFRNLVDVEEVNGVLTVYHRPEAVEADIKQAFEVYGLQQCFEQWKAQCL